MSKFEKGDIGILIVPANLHESIPGIAKKVQGNIQGSIICKNYDLHIGEAVSIQKDGLKNGYYHVICDLKENKPEGWIKESALIGRGEFKLGKGNFPSEAHIKNYYLRVIDILVAKHKTILDTLSTSKLIRIGEVLAQKAAMEALLSVVKIVASPLGGYVFKYAVKEVLPKPKDEVKRKIGEDLKACVKPFYINAYDKVIHLWKNEKEGEGTLRALDKCVENTYYAIVHSMLHREKMEQKTRIEVVEYFKQKTNF